MKSDTFTFSCPACEQHISASSSDMGASSNCPACNAEFVVPGKTIAEQPAAKKDRRGVRNPLLLPLVTVSGLLVVSVVALVLQISSGKRDRNGRMAAIPETVESSELPDSFALTRKHDAAEPNDVANRTILADGGSAPPEPASPPQPLVTAPPSTEPDPVEASVAAGTKPDKSKKAVPDDEALYC